MPTVRLEVPDAQGDITDAEIYFLKGNAGWRADFSNFSPFDGCGGR